MMFARNTPPKGRRREDGVAIIIVLSFVVLLTGLVVAFFSRSLTEQQVSTSAVAQVKADFLAQSALEIITGDLRQELVAGSSGTAATTGTVYIPSSGTTVLPQRDAGLASGTLYNLIRVSSATAPPAPAVETRASAVSSITPSLNLRSISRDRWNSHYLLPLQSGSTTATFTPPSWVYTTGTGPAVVTSGTDATGKSVIGRYAFAIYDEGGLLDINVAGHPSQDAGAFEPRKTGVAYADLTQLSSTATLTTGTGGLVDKIVGWRNHTSAAMSGSFGSYQNTVASGTNYYDYVTTATNGFLVPTGSDQRFESRQSLIRFWKQLNLPLDTLQYFGTHSRDWDFASYTPPSGRPKTSGVVLNDANGADDIINPSFAKFLVSGTFTRLDGTLAEVGQPLVKRFPLSRLGRLGLTTVASATKGDPVYDPFGLSRATATTAGTPWLYRGGGVGGTIMRLDQVAAAGREPDFFELLKAAITAGAVTRASTGTGTPYEKYANERDKRIDYAIIQIGANIIDQYDADGYPTVIQFDGKTFNGVEDLPYLYRVRQSVVKTTLPDPPGASADDPPGMVSGTNLTMTGVAAVLLQPEIWNPHVQGVTPVANRPTQFRFTVDPANAATSGSATVITNVVSITAASEFSTSATGLPGFVDPGSGIGSLAATQIEFGDNGGALFRSPALINQPDTPHDSHASLVIVSSTTAWMLPSVTVSGSYIGIYAGATPLRWIAKDGSGNDAIFSAKQIEVRRSADNGATYRLEYKNSSGGWVVYDEKTGPVGGAQDIQWKNNAADTHGLTENIQTWIFAMDPRTSRFGMPGGYQTTGAAPAPGTAGGNQTGTGATGVPSLAGWTGVAPTFNSDLVAMNRSSDATNYTDADGQLRRALGGAGDSPLAAATNRPVVLDRPFRSVADLGYVFSGLPWKNLDLSFPESGFAAVLDVFSVNEVTNSKGLVAGKVNLNTRQKDVLKAVLTGALKDEITVSGAVIATEAADLANGFVAYSGTQQLRSVREIAGDYVNGAYNGLSTVIGSTLPASDASVIRRREAATRALANSGQTRIWNLFVDIIAQSGRFGGNPAIDKFTVEGEQRYWVHLAIDRLTGKVLDRSIEIVKE